ncbi:hypothetical protein D3C76_1611070 [compost metagenome]
MMELIIVMAPIAMSPPYVLRALLNIMLKRTEANCIANAENPMLIIDLIVINWSLNFCFSIFSLLFLLRK